MLTNRNQLNEVQTNVMTPDDQRAVFWALTSLLTGDAVGDINKSLQQPQVVLDWVMQHPNLVQVLLGVTLAPIFEQMGPNAKTTMSSMTPEQFANYCDRYGTTRMDFQALNIEHIASLFVPNTNSLNNLGGF